jgi:hypothetical protein
LPNSFYQGGFVKGLKLGFGKEYFIEANEFLLQYEGSFKNDARHGNGVYYEYNQRKLEKSY